MKKRLLMPMAMLACLIGSRAHGFLNVSVFATGIQQYDSSGNLLSTADDLSWNLTVDPRGTVYGNTIVDFSIYTYDSDGVRSFFASTANSPLGMAYENEELYAGVAGFRNVQKFDAQGVSQGTFVELSDFGGGPGTPFGVQFDDADNFYVTNNTGVEKFDRFGDSMGQVVSGLSDLAIDVDLDSDGNIYVLAFDDVITKHDPAGTLLTTFPKINNTFSILVDGDEILIGAAGSAIPGFIDRYTLDGQFVSRFADNIPFNPIGLAFSPDSTVDGDFNDDGLYNCLDVNWLTAAIVDGMDDATFDLTGDGLVDRGDLDAWLEEAGSENLPNGNPYLPADANLDGTVDGLDFIKWNEHRFTANPAFCSGDFNADGVVDGQDFVDWNEYRFMSSDTIGDDATSPFVPSDVGGKEFLLSAHLASNGTIAVPEPALASLWLALILSVPALRRWAQSP